jgi:hypothetical protein
VERNKNLLTLKFSDKMFNSDNKLKVYTKEEWDNSFIQLEVEEIEEDELPFKKKSYCQHLSE